MKVLVTGSEGFIGSHLVDSLLARGHDVTALAQYNSFNSVGWLESVSAGSGGSLKIVLGDVRDGGFMNALVAGHDRVAHLAALIAIPYSYVAPSSYLETNAMGTLNLLEACKNHGVERVVHTSTSEVYGTAQYVPIDEKHPLVGQSPYSASKIAADQIAYSYWASFSLPVVTLRPFNAYGPRQSQRAFIPSVMVQHLSGQGELKLGSLSPTRDLTYVTDTAMGFVAALESNDGSGEVFNMGSGFEVSMKDVVGMISEISGRDIPVVTDESRLRPISSEVERLCAESSKMTTVFGWNPSFAGRAGLRKGLESTYEWLSRHQHLPGYQPEHYVV